MRLSSSSECSERALRYLPSLLPIVGNALQSMYYDPVWTGFSQIHFFLLITVCLVFLCSWFPHNIFSAYCLCSFSQHPAIKDRIIIMPYKRSAPWSVVCPYKWRSVDGLTTKSMTLTTSSCYVINYKLYAAVMWQRENWVILKVILLAARVKCALKCKKKLLRWVLYYKVRGMYIEFFILLLS